MTSPLRALRRLAALALLAATAAHAQDAANGKVLYNTRYGTQNQGCYSCHGIQGNTLVNRNNIANGVNNPPVIQAAIDNNTGNMGFLKPFLNPTQVADIAAYLGNPGLVGLGAPQASASPTSLAFAATAVGATSASQTVTLSNPGSATLTLSALSASPAAFRVTGGTCRAGGTVSAGASCTVTVAFAPSAGGAASGSLTVTHNASPSTTTVALSGTGVVQQPVAAASPASLSFTQVVGVTSAAQTVTVSNTGNAPLTLGTMALAGTAAGDYAIGAGGTCASNGSVAAGASCTVKLTFTPAATGARAASLSIPSNAAGSPLTVSLAGTGTAVPQPVLSLDTNALAFPATVVGATSSARTVRVSNTGSAALTINSLALAGAQAADFAIGAGGTCQAGGSVVAGGSCTVAVTFTPRATGARAATLALATNASNAGGAASVSLSGSGTPAPTPVVTLSPSTLDFGAVTVGNAAVPRTVALSNTGNAALAIAGIAATGTGFSVTSDCPASVAAGAGCTLTVGFAPAAAGAASGQVRVTSNAAASPATVALAGTGSLQALPALGWSGTPSGAFGDVHVGTASTPVLLALVNNGPGTATLSAVTVQGPQAGDFTLGGTCAAGVALPAGQSCTVAVTFAPAAVGARAATLDVASDGTDPAPVALSGQGLAVALPALGLSATTLTFADTLVGTPPAPLPLRLSNTGNATLTVQALTFGNAAFSATPSATQGCAAVPMQLAPGAECSLDVAVSAANAGTYDATLTVTSDATNAPAPVALHAQVSTPTAPPTIPNEGGGGCSLADPAASPAVDPVLWALAAVAAAVLWRRRRDRPARARARDR